MRVHGMTGLVVIGLALCGCAPVPPTAPALILAEESSVMPGEQMPPRLLNDAQSDRMAFDQAVAAGSNAALIMFLARNPASSHAAAARAQLALRRTADASAVTGAVAGTDVSIVAAFDAARLSGDPAALIAFVAQYGNHPLAAEARRLSGG